MVKIYVDLSSTVQNKSIKTTPNAWKPAILLHLRKLSINTQFLKLETSNMISSKKTGYFYVLKPMRLIEMIKFSYLINKHFSREIFTTTQIRL